MNLTSFVFHQHPFQHLKEPSRDKSSSRHQHQHQHNDIAMSDDAWVDFASGWVSGGVSVLACQPIDTVLTRMQAKVSIQQSAANGAEKVPPKSGAVSLNIFRGMVSNFGVTSLWRGSSAMIGAVPIQNALLMTGYGAGKRWSESNGSSDGKHVLKGVFVGGCTGGVLQSFVMSPVRIDLSSLCRVFLATFTIRISIPLWTKHSFSALCFRLNW